MIAGDIRFTIDRRMALTAAHGPARIRVERRLFTGRRQPLRGAAHLPRIAVKNVEPACYPRRNIGRKQLRHVNHVVKAFTPLQPLGHARQQLADGPVGIALFFQALSRKAVFTKDADGLGHVTNFINLAEVGRFDGVILRRQAVHHVAQTYHRAEHATFQYETENKQEQQGGQANHHFRGRAQRFRFFRRLPHGGNHALVEYLAKAIDLGLRALKLLFVGHAIEQGNGLFIFAPRCARQCRLLLVLQLIDDL